MRITGMATGLDMDEIIKNSMKPYRIKVDQMTQKKDVVEIKQKLYRDIMSDASKFYDKYFDLTKSDSLLKSSNYKSVSFTSSSDAVKVTAGSGAKAGNYKITGETAIGAKATTDSSVFGTEYDKDGVKYKKIKINDKEFEVKSDTEKAMAKDLNEQLKKAGVNVSVEYTDFAGDGTTNKSGFIFQSTVLGADTTFTINGTKGTEIGIKTSGVDATKATVTGFTIDDIKNSDKISINGKEIDLKLTEEEKKDNKLILKKVNDKLSSEEFTVSEESGNIKFISSKLGKEVTNPNITIGGKTAIFTPGVDSEKATVTIDKSSLSGDFYTIGGNTIKIDLTKVDPGKEKEYLDKLFSESGINVTAEVIGDKIKLTSKKEGTSGAFNVTKAGSNGSGITFNPGKDGDITITNTKTGGVYKTSGKSNTITVDDVTFTFDGEIPKDGGVKITGKNDVTETKDKLVNFINDYNTLMEKLNTLTMTKHDKGYTPLTAEQKKEMSESEIKLWNERVEKGQLNKDSDLTRIANSMKETMRTFMNDSGLNLEKIGINPVKDYSGTKNGTFIIDEDKLTKALEENTEDVMNLFIKSAPTKEELDKLSPEDKVKRKDQTGLLIKLKETLYNEFKTSASSLSKKVGMEGTATFTNNTLTKSMSDYEKKIKDMEKSFSRREQALYSKYATLEKMMNNLNSQQSNLMSQLGMS
ncbi:flagellar cap protein FliD [Clostridium botulinum]|uniref:flagellar filament capping protein FliD n=1 Tax=Clostridium botulinum TaxID=1491 RepID=UPI0013C6E6C0|nr:flagellar filament capping protein FliD [Clostridium botulinum]MBY6836424.1 flagellar filament capping protein FliD [Clostridium botulinum]NFG64268.1 flagellar cap protein FliD [Clostridium botulinum]NFN18129.1 flagellar cap protein FliD [Clostridium botulinum]NFN47818.1 flagellar cap protein FliD [Clostridium botulinum]NFQ23040.1 flagellar cap protein FliD [Clostridium botulinum]